MSRISPLFVVAICLLSGCIFTVETELQELGDDAGYNDVDTGDVDALNDPTAPSVAIVDPEAVAIVDRDAAPLVEYTVQCEPEGCEEDLRCRLQEGEEWSEWWDCGLQVELTNDHVREGEHIFEVELMGDFDEAVSDSHTMVLLFDFSLTVDIDDGPETLPYYYPRDAALECTHEACQIECRWEDENGEEIGAGDCDDEFATVALPEGHEEAELVISACADIALPDDHDHCLPEQGYSFVKTDPTWLAVDAGARHTCAILVDNTLWCWGRNNAGQLGIGNTSESSVPRKVSDRSWTSLSAGLEHSCAIDGEGRLYCWGDNSYGQLGVSSADTQIPLEVEDLADHGPWQRVSAGGSHICALNEQGQLFCRGDNSWGQRGNGDDENDEDPSIPLPADDLTAWLAVSAGDLHSCAIAERDDGTGAAYCWGQKSSGRLGNNETSGSTEIPQEVQGDLPNWDTQLISAGKTHTCAIANFNSTRQTYCWGNGDEGKLGTGNDQNWPTPQRVARSDDLFSDYGPNDFDDYLEITTGSDHSCGVHEDGNAFCWGDNIRGQLGTGGDPTNTPARVAAALDQLYRQLSAGEDHSCAIDNEDALYCWGRADHGRLGLGIDGGDYIEAHTPTIIQWPY